MNIVRDLRELRINEGGLPPSRPAPTRSVIEEFEQKFDVQLHRGLAQLLMVANGGHPELDVVGGKSGQFAVCRFYHLSADDRGTESLWFALEYWRPIIGINALPFAFDGGNKQFYLDQNKFPSPVRLWIDEEIDSVYIAATFEEFIDSLDLDPDMI